MLRLRVAVIATVAAWAAALAPQPALAAEPTPPDQVHLAWTGDPATTLTVVWRTRLTSSPHTVRYRGAGDSEWLVATGAARPSGTAGTLHETVVSGLSPATRYEYQVPGDSGAWSSVFETRTAPLTGKPAEFDVVYYADTGLIGRTDGLATGTRQAIDAIAALRPLAVLPGGDYAYFNTDKRFGTLENSIDAWFNQQQPILSRSPAMPTYGNHEVLLGESYDAWARRFPTPSGTDGRRLYSFDIGDVHFVSVFAVAEQHPLTSSQLRWLEQDIAAANAAGASWVVPYMHVSAFADGFSHPSNLALRAQLGPVFERLGVKLVLASHDQSYERTYPLRGVPQAIERTSSGLHCYGPSDGVTWAKVSPAGKLSNKTGSFSRFRTMPPPSWTAFRDDQMHHFAHLRVGPGRLRLEVKGFTGTGAPPVVLDAFEYRADGCELSFSPTAVSFEAVAGDPAPPDARVTLSTPDGVARAVTVSDDAEWLTVTPSSAATPIELSLRVDPRRVGAGRHTAHVTAMSGDTSLVLPVTLVVVPRDGARTDAGGGGGASPDRGQRADVAWARVADKHLRAGRRGRFTVRLTFAADAPTGAVALTVKRKGRPLARARAAVRPGRWVVVPLRLSSAGRRGIRRGETKRVRLRVTLPAGSVLTRTLPLRRRA